MDSARKFSIIGISEQNVKLGSVKDLSFKENYLQRQIVEAVTRIAEFFSDLENSGGHAKFFFSKTYFSKKKELEYVTSGYC